MCKEYVRDLAGAVISSVNPTSYGRMRTKLNKQGFSEIAIYKAITKHCIENDIDPKSMAKETQTYIEGCALNMFHPKVSNDFHFLRGQFHKLRHGDLKRDEAKSPEQKGNFLCNHCYHILPDRLRCGGKNEKYLCASCKSIKSKAAYNKKKREGFIKSQSEQTSTDKAPVPVHLSTTSSGFKHEDATNELSAALSQLPETPKKENPQWEPQAKEPEQPVVEEPVNDPIGESIDQLIEEQTPEEPISDTKEEPIMNEQAVQPSISEPKRAPIGAEVKVTEVMADENNATISLQCSTEQLHLVLHAIKTL